MTESKTVTLEYTYTADDLVKAGRLARKLYPWYYRIIWRIALFLLLVSFFMGLPDLFYCNLHIRSLGDALDYMGWLLQYHLWTLISAALSIIIILDLIPWIQMRAAVRRAPALLLPRKWLISEEKLLIQTALATSDITWPFFTKWAENEQGFVLLHGTAMFYAIPKRAFASAEDMGYFRDLLKRNIPAQK